MLPDSAGEDQGIQPAEGGGHGRHRAAKAVEVDVGGEGGGLAAAAGGVERDLDVIFICGPSTSWRPWPKARTRIVTGPVTS